MSSPITDNDIEAIRQLLQIVSDNGLTELTYKVSDGVSVTIKCETQAPVAAPHPAMLPAPQHVQRASQSLNTQQAPSLAAPASSAKKGTPVNSPATGIYYQSPSPGDPAFVKVGDTVKVGQVIGLLEAMKVFSDIHSEAAGKVTEISAMDGQLVRDGDPILFLG